MELAEAPEPNHPVVTSLIRSATVEVIPLKSVRDKIVLLPPDSTLTITCSPRFGLDRTLEYVETAARAGYRVVPHLAARQVRDRSELSGFVARIRAAGVTDLYVIGGDA